MTEKSSTINPYPEDAQAVIDSLLAQRDRLEVEKNTILYDAAQSGVYWQGRALAAEKVANATVAFCEELCEDSPDLSQFELRKLHEALDEWEAGKLPQIHPDKGEE